ncbi:MAG: 50S ribosomal protein L18Ae [Halobellus sp.]|uniref:50S ribosomal protein L18Ae n=1 Tax=Halobellus sp. TaxID=1979212 RepID=UPI0035D4FB0A
MSKFAVSGRFQSRDGLSEFNTVVDAPNEDVAAERVYTNFGSQHGLKRTQIEIDDVAAAEEAAV